MLTVVTISSSMELPSRVARSEALSTCLFLKKLFKKHYAGIHLRLKKAKLSARIFVKNKFKHLSRWREYAEIILRSAKEFDNHVKVYVFGGVAEDRITVLSDIDILILFPGKLTDKEIIELRRKIFLNAVDKYGLPFDAPVELHVVDDERVKEYFRIAKKMILVTNNLDL